MTAIVTFELLHKNAKIPAYMTAGSAGADVSAVDAEIIPSGHTGKIRTGLKMAVSAGYEVQVRSRSGMAVNGVFVTNSPGTIDSDYRGELFIVLTNLSGDYLVINPGDRIAQIVVAPTTRGIFHTGVVNETETARGAGGGGSTGV